MIFLSKPIRSILLIVIIVGLLPITVLAQGAEEEFLPIAKLFDSPWFFWSVMGSAIVFIVASIFFLFYTKKLESLAEEWGKGKRVDELIELLKSPVEQESRMAYIYLRNHSREDDQKIIASELDKDRQKGKINPSLIYLLEDLKATCALPVLEQISLGKSGCASLAQHAAEKISAHLDQEKSQDKPAEANS